MSEADPAVARPAGRYSTVAIVLHWLIAATIVVQLALAWRMQGASTPETFAVTQLHKSVGVTILFLSLARLAWRLANPPPPMPATLKRWERRLAGGVHAALYVFMIGMPLTGWIMVSTARIELPTFLYSLVPWPHIPGLAGLEGSARTAWNGVGFAGHMILAWSLFLLLALHVAGALKHQLFSSDESVLARMAPGAQPGRWREPRLLAILMGAAAAAGLGLIVTPPRPVVSPPAPAADAATATPAISATGVPNWVVAPGGTLQFTTRWGQTPVSGRFDRWRAQIAFDPGALDRSRIRIEVDLDSVRTGDAQRDAALLAPDWFGVAVHPTAVFAADRFEKLGPEQFVAHGQLTLRGTSRPVDLGFRLSPDPNGERTFITGSAQVDRTGFGVGRGEWAGVTQVPAKVFMAFLFTATRAGS